MALRNVMKEYLVSLGFNVDRNKLSDALDVVKLGEGKISSLVSKMSTSLGKGTAGIVTMIASASLLLLLLKLIWLLKMLQIQCG